MKVKSLVVCIDDNFSDWFLKDTVEVPNKKDIYTIREIRKDPVTGMTGILLEEIQNGKNKHGLEWGFYSFRFKEVQKPIDIQDLIKGDYSTSSARL